MAELIITEGTEVRVGAKNGVIARRVSLTMVLVEFGNGEARIVPIERLKAPETSHAIQKTSDSLSSKAFEIATRRMELIAPLLKYRRIPGSEMAAVSEATGLHRTTILRMIKKHIDTKNLVAYAPPNRPGGRGKSRLSPKVEAVIQDLIKSHWLNKQNISRKDFHRQVLLVCANLDLPAPEIKTIYRRLDAIPRKLQIQKRQGYAEAQNQFRLLQGNIPGATHVLAIVQMDHTESDLILVDEQDRLPIGRAVISAAVDVLTGMCVSLCVNLRAPSTDVAGACLFRCLVPKTEWLSELGLDCEWVIWGYPDTLHLDNASEFRSRSFSTTLMELNINQVFRPVGAPRYGGHIENVMKLINKVVHSAPGTTKTSIEKRGSYKSVEKAAIAIKGLERLLINAICNEYHKTPLEDGLTPEEHLKLAIEKEYFIPGKFQALPKTREDRDLLRIRCMPMKLVTVQRYGIQIDKLRYSDAVLNTWVGEHNPKREDKKFIIRRDPADWSVIYFLDPRTDRYYPIGFQNYSNPRFGEIEYRRAVEGLEKDRREITEAAIVERIRRHNQIVDAEVSKTNRSKRERRRSEAIKHRPKDLDIAAHRSTRDPTLKSPADAEKQITDTFDTEDI
jgi:putative transposase